MRIGRTSFFHHEVNTSESCLSSRGCDTSTDKESMIQDQIRVLFQLESKYNSFYVISANGSLLEREQHGEWRGKICEWCYRVVDHYQYDREVVSIAMDYFDRFLVTQQEQNNVDSNDEMSSLPSRKYQLAAMTSLYIAIKLHAEVGVDSCDMICSEEEHCLESEHVRPYRKTSLKLQSYVDLSRGQFTTTDVLHMEQKLLACLNWRVNPVSPMCFVSYMVRLFSPQCANYHQQKKNEIVLHVLHELSRYLTELAICLPSINNTLKPISTNCIKKSCKKAYSPSSIAYASILVSMDLITLEALPTSMRQAFTHRISVIAFEASSFSNDNEHFYFNPIAEEVKELKIIIRSSFQPGDVLQGAEEGSEEYLQHPITIAKVAGFLNIDDSSTDEIRWTNEFCESHHENNMYEENLRSSGSPTSVSRISKISSGSKKLFRFNR